MSNKKNKPSSNSYTRSRRKIALAHLRRQLDIIEENNKESINPLDLSKDAGYIRIKKEIATLEERL